MIYAETLMKDFYYHINWAGAIFVKDGDFFVQQGGLQEKWGRAWKKIQAKSLDHAREIAISIKSQK